METQRVTESIAEWRAAQNSLMFRSGNGTCFVHRGAFKTLMDCDPTPIQCVAFFDRHKTAFAQAALVKFDKSCSVLLRSFHLTSRDLGAIFRCSLIAKDLGD